MHIPELKTNAHLKGLQTIWLQLQYSLERQNVEGGNKSLRACQGLGKEEGSEYRDVKRFLGQRNYYV